MKPLLPLLLAIAAMLASCAPTAQPPPLLRMAPPQERPEIAQSADAVGAATTATRREADALRYQIGQLRRTAMEATGAAQRGNAELGRLVEQKSATEAELVNLQLLFSDLTRRNLFLESEAERLEASHDGLEDAVVRLEETVEDLHKESAAKDAEVRELRRHLDAATTYATELHSENQRLATAAAKAEVKGAAKGAYRTLVFVGIGLVAVVAVIWIVANIAAKKIPI